MKWILKKTKITEDFINVENQLNVKFPSDFKEIVLEHNGASPEKMTFDTQITKVAEYLLSFYREDKENIISIYDSIKDRLGSKLIPIMRDPFGNYICFNYITESQSELYFWNKMKIII